MLGLMRKYQKYIYFLVTFIIVVSFSFFGTYGSLGGNSIHEQIAFTTISGQTINRSELEEMAVFIGTDSEDKKLFGGIWGPNFLNDGVIRKDFFEPGLAELLIAAYADDLQIDLKQRFVREKRYTPYVHPEAPFLSSRNAWAYFAPNIGANLDKLQKASDPLSQDAIDARVQLYLAEKRLPGPYLQQILMYQEKQNKWIPHDPELERSDLSLFGYHTVSDWFGPRFDRLVAEFIFNAAAIAEERGYKVTKDEAFASLVINAQRSFQENQNSPYLSAANPMEYLEQQLQRMRLDKTKAVKLWQKVLLFRRLFDDVGQSVFVTPRGYKMYNSLESEIATGDLYRLPEALKFSDFQSLQRFETYLDAVSKRTKEDKAKLLLPKTLLTAAEVSKKTPELTQKRYVLEIGSVKKSNLAARVTVKETMAWELDDKNWNNLKKEFPELGLKKGDSTEEKLKALDSLDSITRSRLDAYARKQIVELSPTMLTDALKAAPVKQEKVAIPLKGHSAYFAGLENGEAFMKLLDQDSSKLSSITFDQDAYYKIKVVEKSPELEVLTFQEANALPVLDELSDRALEIYYAQVKGQETFQNKPFEEVKDKVALAYYKPQLETINAALLARADKDLYKNLPLERLAAYRFLPAAQETIKELKQKPESLELTGSAYVDQFKWKIAPLHISRGSEEIPQAAALFETKPGTWSEPALAANGDLLFAFVKQHAPGNEDLEKIDEQMARARFLLGTDAERIYLQSLIPMLKAKKAISFEYLSYGESVMESDA